MTLTSLAQKHNIDHENAKAFLREWLDMQNVWGYMDEVGSLFHSKEYDSDVALIARPTDLGE